MTGHNVYNVKIHQKHTELYNEVYLNFLDLAHHIIPLNKQGHEVVQKAARSSNAFHLNEALNGIPIENAVHYGSHAAYDNRILNYLDAIPENATPDQAFNAIQSIINTVRTAIQNHTNVPLNQIVF